MSVHLLQEVLKNLACSQFVLDILIQSTKNLVGKIVLQKCIELKPAPHNVDVLPLSAKKRPIINQNKPVLHKKPCFSVPNNNFKALQNDLESMGIMPAISDDDLTCKLCGHAATRKYNLKIHYKLKHFGGGDLAMDCQICGVKVKTKGTIKKHYMKVHNLTDSAASNMAESSHA